MQLTVRNLLAFFVADALLISGSVRKAVKKVLNEKVILSIYCHDPGKPFFESSIRWLKKRGFRFISVNELAAIIAGDIDFPKGAVIVTADDGWRNNKGSIVAVANKYKIPLTIFVSTDPVSTGDAYWWSYISRAKEAGLTGYSLAELKKVDNNERIKAVQEVKMKMPLQREAFTVKELRDIMKTDLISIQSHTVSHPILTQCSDEKAWYEINQSKKIIENWFEKKVFSFAYPNGNYSSREIAYLSDSGYQLAFTTRDNYITPGNVSEKFTLPRVDLIESVSFAENICRITGVWFKKRDQINSLFK